MRVLLSWTYNDGYSEADQARVLALFGEWQPVILLQEFSAFADGGGGFALIDSDDPEALLRVVAPWTPWLTFTIRPFVPIETLATVSAEAAAFRASVA